MMRVLVEDMSDIICSFSTDRHQGLGTDVLVVSFAGTYGYGTLGNKDAAFLKAETFRGIWAFDPDAVIFP